MDLPHLWTYLDYDGGTVRYVDSGVGITEVFSSLHVVTPHGQVIGVEDLYVVDASIMRTTVRAHTNCATIAMAERAVDLLRA